MAERAENRIDELIARYGGAAGAAPQLLRYYRLLVKWGARIDLTSSTEWQSVEPLFEEAFWAASFYPQKKNLYHLDIGSGAGFPALPIRILCPDGTLELIESRLRRAVFLQHTIEELGLRDTHVSNQRLAEYLAGEKSGWDLISWKGVKLQAGELGELIARSSPSTQFWMFHGAELPVSDPAAVNGRLTLLRRETFARKAHWFLSIFRPR